MKVNQNKEFYLGFPNFETRKLCLYQSIISYHNLQIETGRYTQKNNQKLFLHCKVVEDEEHFEEIFFYSKRNFLIYIILTLEKPVTQLIPLMFFHVKRVSFFIKQSLELGTGVFYLYLILT